MKALQCITLTWAMVFAACTAEGHEVQAGKLVLIHPWVRAAPAGAMSTAGYGKITNTGKVADRLIGASLSGASLGEIQSTTIIDGIAKVRPLPDGIPIAPGQTVELKPGGLHLVFTSLTKSLEEDTYVDVHLTFEKAGQVAVEFAVEPVASTAPAHDAHHHHRK
jgi:copper(I)-binding protein